VYPLNDQLVCASSLTTLRNFLTTFWPQVGADMTGACDTHKLMTCQLIGQELATSALLTILGSVGAAVFSLQLILDFAVLHERAICVRDLALLEAKYSESKDA